MNRPTETIKRNENERLEVRLEGYQTATVLQRKKTDSGTIIENCLRFTKTDVAEDTITEQAKNEIVGDDFTLYEDSRCIFAVKHKDTMYGIDYLGSNFDKDVVVNRLTKEAESRAIFVAAILDNMNNWARDEKDINMWIQYIKSFLNKTFEGAFTPYEIKFFNALAVIIEGPEGIDDCYSLLETILDPSEDKKKIAHMADRAAKRELALDDELKEYHWQLHEENKENKKAENLKSRLDEVFGD